MVEGLGGQKWGFGRDGGWSKGMGGGVGFSKGCQWSNRVWASMVGGGAKGLVREQKKKEGLEWKTSQLLPPAGTAQNLFLPLPLFFQHHSSFQVSFVTGFIQGFYFEIPKF